MCGSGHREDVDIGGFFIQADVAFWIGFGSLQQRDMDGKGLIPQQLAPIDL